MSENAPIFTPFTPGAPSLLPEQPAETPKKRERKTRQKRSRKIKGVEAPPVTKVATPPEQPASRQRRTRKPRQVGKVRTPRSMKLPVDVMLSALSSLKGDDGALFEKLLGILNAAGKPQRARVMAALAKVFA